LTADLNILDARISAGRDIVEASVAIEGGKILRIGKRNSMPRADDEINARGMLLIPGLIDVHVHFRDPGETNKEDWSSGSKDALLGGVTTVFDMPNNRPKPTVDLAAVEEKRKEAQKKSLVNYGIYAGVTESNLERIKDLAPKVCGFKLYMGETTGSLAMPDPGLQKKAFEAVVKTGKVLVVHAEDHEINSKALEKNKTKDDILAHSRSHPPESEIRAVGAVIENAVSYGTKTHITHVSTEGGIALIQNAKKSGIALSCDTACHYLLLNQTNTEVKGVQLKVTPPLRTTGDQNALWSAIEAGIVDVIASDHAPHQFSEKECGVWDSPSGIPSVGLTLPLLMTEINNKRLTLSRLIELTSQKPAVVFGIKNKGYILDGFDADLVLLDPKSEKQFNAKDSYSKSGWSPYEGWTLTGWPHSTIVAGNRVYDDGIIFDEFKGNEVIN
jgi:dihydroorotase (multifunctional complex type)